MMFMWAPHLLPNPDGQRPAQLGEGDHRRSLEEKRDCQIEPGCAKPAVGLLASKWETWMRVLRGEAPHLSTVEIKKQIFVSSPNDPVILQGNAMPDKMSFLLGIALSFVPFLPALCFSLSEGCGVSPHKLKRALDWGSSIFLPPDCRH